MIYLVSYNPTDKDAQIVAAIQSTPTLSWWHFLDNTWMVSTTETIQQLYSRLEAALPTTVLLIEIAPTATYWGRLPTQAWAWIKEQRKQ